MSAYEEVTESRIIWSRDYVGADGTALIWSGVLVEIDLGRLTRLIYRSSPCAESQASRQAAGKTHPAVRLDEPPELVWRASGTNAGGVHLTEAIPRLVGWRELFANRPVGGVRTGHNLLASVLEQLGREQFS